MTRKCASSKAIVENPAFALSEAKFRARAGRFAAFRGAVGPFSGRSGHLRAELPIQYCQLLAHQPQVRGRVGRGNERGIPSSTLGARKLLIWPDRHCNPQTTS